MLTTSLSRSLDVTSTTTLEAAVTTHDLVISLIPYTLHAAVIKAAIKGRTHVVAMSYVSPAIEELDAEAKKTGIVLLNEVARPGD
jgi:saccharopine dehydrogenase-like NADP-dependent oxidoreductase